MTPAQEMLSATVDYPLPNGEVLHIRPVRPEDEPLLAEAFRSASRTTRLNRFFSAVPEVPPEQLRQMLALDPERELCLVGCLARDERIRIVCGARYVRSEDPARAEFAVTVHDEFQHLGLGSVLMNRLARLARANGIDWFEADILASNAAMLGLLSKCFSNHILTRTGGDVLHAVVDLRNLTP